jgi:hypothetical protein
MRLIERETLLFLSIYMTERVKTLTLLRAKRLKTALD